MSDDVQQLLARTEVLPLRAIEVPGDIFRMDGCSCGGREWHLLDCTIHELTEEQYDAALARSLAKEREFTDGLNAKLRAAGL